MALATTTTREVLSDDALGLPWTSSRPGNHNTDGVVVQRLNPSGMPVQVLAVRFQGTVPCMCAEPLAAEVIHRVHAHARLVNLVARLQNYLSVAAQDGAYDSELSMLDEQMKQLL